MRQPRQPRGRRHVAKSAFILLLGAAFAVGLASCSSGTVGYRSLDDYKEAASSVEYNPDYSGPMFPAQATEDGLLGFIGIDGKWAIEPSFSDAYVFSDGLALVCDPETNDFGYIDESHIVGSSLPIWGLLDEEGNWVVEPLFYFIRTTNIGPMLNLNDNPVPILSSAGMGAALKASDGISD